MGNGQLKPAFNLQHGVDSEYITWLTVGPQPTDTATLIPFLKEAKEYLKFKYIKVIADAGYESEENYLFLEENGQTAFIKPSNYEISKRRNYKNDIGRMENMDYDVEKDLYLSGIPNRKQDMSVRKIFISVPPVKIAHIKASVSKETTARPQWKREIKFFLLQEPF